MSDNDIESYMGYAIYCTGLMASTSMVKLTVSSILRKVINPAQKWLFNCVTMALVIRLTPLRQTKHLLTILFIALMSLYSLLHSHILVNKIARLLDTKYDTVES